MTLAGLYPYLIWLCEKPCVQCPFDMPTTATMQYSLRYVCPCSEKVGMCGPRVPRCSVVIPPKSVFGFDYVETEDNKILNWNNDLYRAKRERIQQFLCDNYLNENEIDQTNFRCTKETGVEVLLCACYDAAKEEEDPRELCAICKEPHENPRKAEEIEEKDDESTDDKKTTVEENKSPDDKKRTEEENKSPDDKKRTEEDKSPKVRKRSICDCGCNSFIEEDKTGGDSQKAQVSDPSPDKPEKQTFDDKQVHESESDKTSKSSVSKRDHLKQSEGLECKYQKCRYHKKKKYVDDDEDQDEDEIVCPKRQDRRKYQVCPPVVGGKCRELPHLRRHKKYVTCSKSPIEEHRHRKHRDRSRERTREDEKKCRICSYISKKVDKMMGAEEKKPCDKEKTEVKGESGYTDEELKEYCSCNRQIPTGVFDYLIPPSRRTNL